MNSIDRSFVSDAQLDSRGRIVLLTSLNNIDEADTAKPGIIRLNANGSYDASFDGDGRKLVSDLAFENVTAYPPQLEVLGNDQLVLAGNVFNTSFENLTVVYRLRANGSLDSSFDQDGQKLLPLEYGAAQELEVQSDGRILLGVTQWDGQSLGIYRLRTNGALDTSFDGDGRRTIQVTHDVRHSLVDLQVLSDGRILATGNTYAPSYPIDRVSGFIAKLKTNGRSDSSFGGNGMIQSGDYFTPGNERAFNEVFVSNSTLHVASNSPILQSYDSVMLKIKPSGSLDDSFGIEGIQPLPTNLGRPVPTVRLSNGKFIGVGDMQSAPVIDFFNPGGAQLYRLNSNATLDSTFKNGGLAIFGAEVTRRAAIDATGRLVVAGGNYRNTAIATFLANGQFDSTYAAGGLTTFPFDGLGYYGGELIAFGDGRMLLNATGYDSSDGDFNAVLTEWLLPNGSVDTRFPRSNYLGPSGDETSNGEVRLVANGWTSAAWETYRGVRTAKIFDPNGNSRFGVPYIGEVDSLGGKSFSSDYILPINQGNGGYYVLGDARYEFDEPDPAELIPVLARFTPAGVLDESFGNGGFNIGFTGAPLFAQNDGSLIFKRTNGGIARLKANNTIDNSFGNAGAAGAGFDHFEADSAGRIIAWRQLVGGAADGDVQVMRFTRNGKTDTTFGGGDGLTMVDTRLPSSAKANLLVTPGDDLVITALKQNGDESANWFATRLIG